jgi:hypothetical protein
LLIARSESNKEEATSEKLHALERTKKERRRSRAAIDAVDMNHCFTEM